MLKRNYFIIKLLLVFSIYFLSSQLISAQNEDYEDYGMGVEYDLESDGTAPIKATLLTRDYESVPGSYSLKQYCPTPRSQSIYGTCVGWSTTYAALTICEAILNNWNDRNLITQEAFAPLFTYKQLQPEGDCRIGTSIADGLKLLKEKGAPKMASFDVLCSPGVPQYLFTEAAKHKIDGYTKLFDQKYNPFTKELEEVTPYATKINSVKKALTENRPVVASIKIHESFNNPKDYWKGEEDNVRGYHAMCVVGYDDNKYGGAFEIMNSWGPTWGNNGFIWVRYSDFFKICRYAYEVNKNKPLVTVVPDKKRNSFNGSVTLQRRDGGKNLLLDFQDTGILPYYKARGEYLSGQKFRLYVSNDQPAWVYVISSDKQNNVNKLFPSQDNISALLDYKKNNVAIPDESHEFQFDNVAGTDYFCVLYSKEELDINKIVNEMKRNSGSFYEKLHKALGTKLVAMNECQYGRNNMNVNATSDSSVVPLILEINHK